ncbi:polysaccharide biosynthesis C-terminal domain-containing protein [candidate division KSB1 bacterium]|nr:polysaccharide biosynthesis C-terminal domain-containing protein [candidate division KSB1 bacterium]
MSVIPSIKRLIKHSAVYGLGHILTRSIGFFLLPLYTNVFTADAFGIVALMVTYLTISTLLYSYGLDAGFMRYYILAEDRPGRRLVFSTAFVTLFISSLIFSLLLFSFAGPLSRILFTPASQMLSIDLPLLLRLLAGILFCDTVAFIPLLVLRAEEKSWPFIVIKIASGCVNFAANILFIIGWHMGVEGVFYANLTASLATLMLAIPIIYQTVVLQFSWRSLRELLSFGAPFILAGIAIAVMDSVDRIFLERLQSVQTAGLYNAGAKLGMIMGLFVAAFRFAWHPFFLATCKQTDARQIFSKIFTYLLLAGFTLLLFITFFIDPLVRLRFLGYTVFGNAFWSSTAIVPLIMLAYLFHAAYLIFEAALYLYKKSLIIALITTAGMIVNILANVLLIPHLDMFGAAWARVIAYTFMAAGLYYFSQKYYHVSYEWPRLLRLFLIVGILLFLNKTLLADSSWPVQLGLFLCFPIILFCSGFFTRRELEKFRQILKQYSALLFNQEKS